MARFPQATWIGPTPNRNASAMGAVRGLVLHIQQGTEQGSEAWMKNPVSKVSAHFLNPKSGKLRQLVDTADRAWAQADGNDNWISIENEGQAGDLLTESQVENTAQLLTWLHQTKGVPLQISNKPSTGGLGWHGMGGAAWGNHPSCPGGPIVAERPAILRRAQQLSGVLFTYVPFPGAGFFTMGRRSPIVAAMHERLVDVGCSRYKSTANKDTIGSGDVASYEAWQHKCGYSGAAATWPPGKKTWDLLRVPE